MNIEQLQDKIEELVEDFMEDSETVRPEQLGLDNRAGYDLRVHKDYIAVDFGYKRALEYYGGFEYVDERYKMMLGSWTIYLAEDDRVKEHIDRFFSNVDEEDLVTLFYTLGGSQNGPSSV